VTDWETPIFVDTSERYFLTTPPTWPRYFYPSFFHHLGPIQQIFYTQRQILTLFNQLCLVIKNRSVLFTWKCQQFNFVYFKRPMNNIRPILQTSNFSHKFTRLTCHKKKILRFTGKSTDIYNLCAFKKVCKIWKH
jgi:hypothetical protein